MLTEYALTPHLFDDEHNVADPAWLDQLRAFGARLLPVGEGRVFNTVVSDLHDENWFPSGFVPLVESLERRQEEDPDRRLPALDLLKTLRPQLERHLVRRPRRSNDYPDTEDSWVNEAFGSAALCNLPIHRVVASSRFVPAPNAADKPVLLRETQAEPFWDTVPTTQTPPADVTAQCNTIRRMCMFYGFLAFVSPHIDAQGSTDLRFAIELVQMAFTRPRGYAPPVRIDLHTEGPRDAHLRGPLVQRVCSLLRSKLGARANAIRLFLWPALLERHLLVGHARGGQPSVTWAVSLTHVARPDLDGPNQDPATFALLPASRTSKLASRYYSSPPAPAYAGSPFFVP